MPPLLYEGEVAQRSCDGGVQPNNPPVNFVDNPAELLCNSPQGGLLNFAAPVLQLQRRCWGGVSEADGGVVIYPSP